MRIIMNAAECNQQPKSVRRKINILFKDHTKCTRCILFKSNEDFKNGVKRPWKQCILCRSKRKTPPSETNVVKDVIKGLKHLDKIIQNCTINYKCNVCKERFKMKIQTLVNALRSSPTLKTLHTCRTPPMANFV